MCIRSMLENISIWIQCRDPIVERLTFHLQDVQSVSFKDSESLHQVLNRIVVEMKMFAHWLESNRLHDDTRKLIYSDFPTKWVRHGDDNTWTLRKSRKYIGCIFFVHPTVEKVIHLATLLSFPNYNKTRLSAPNLDLQSIEKLLTFSKWILMVVMEKWEQLFFIDRSNHHGLKSHKIYRFKMMKLQSV